MKKIVSLVLAMVLALSLTACGKTTVSLDKSEHTFTAAGETVQLTAEVKKADSIGWTSSNEAVATVDANGVVTAVAPGTATITVTAGEVSAACTVTCDWVNPVVLGTFYDEFFNSLYPLDDEGYSTGPFAMDLMSEESGMTAEDAAIMLEMYYPGLSTIETNQLHVYIPMMSAVAYEVVLIEVANEADVDAVKAILQDRIDAQVAGGAWYPETIEQWEQFSRIVSNGCYIMLAVGTDCDAFVEAFNAQF